ncbi:MAG TPA: hypothetical protein VJ957_09740 [Longimicrobiales bacterium]|nr:hypothetical protein [Longimicrobiales bacterium]
MRQALLIIATVVVLLALLGFVGIARPLRGGRAWALLVAGLALVVVAFFT